MTGSATRPLTVYRVASEEDVKAAWDAAEDRASRSAGKDGLRMIGRTDKIDQRWSDLVDALAAHECIDRADQLEAVKAEWIKNFRCPFCGGSAGFARRDKIPGYEGIRVSCGHKCNTGDVLNVLGLPGEVEPVTVIGRRENDGDEDPKQNKSVATQLIHLARSEFAIRLASDGTVFAVPLDGPRIVYPLRGGTASLRATLARRYFRSTAGPRRSRRLPLLTLEGFGQEDENPEQLHLRVAATGGVLWLDLGDQTGRAVRIDADGWYVADEVPVLFRRTSLTAPLPEPKRGGNLDLLWARFNAAEEDRPLVLAALVAALMPDVPHVILGLFGEQGSAKTTAAKQLVRLIDPSPVEVRKPPRDQEQWVTAASGSWVVALDNLSHLPDWLSDALCRAATGD